MIQIFEHYWIRDATPYLNLTITNDIILAYFAAMDDHIIYDEPIISPEGTEDECTPEEGANVRTQEEEDGDPELTVENNNVSTMESGFQAVEKKRSLVWLEFLTFDKTESSDGKQRSICKHCQKASFITDPHYGTQNMQRHLRKCSAYEKYMKNQGGNASNKGKIFNQIVYRNLVAKAIIKHGYAFSWVEHDGNREIHAYLSDDVKFICRNTAKADCLKMHKTLKAQLKETLSKVSSRISLTCDMWTSCQTEGYLCLTAHYVDDNWKLISTVLNFSHIDSPHTGKTMYSAVLSMLQDWGIDDKIFCFTLDNASSNDRMQDYLKETLLARDALLYNGEFFHVRCAAHVLNLIVKDGLKVIEHIVEKVRHCVKKVKYSETRKNTFRSCVSLAKIKETKSLWLDVPTRWNSTYMMLDRAILYREAFREMSEVQKWCPTSEEWDVLEKIRDVLEPFYEITKMFSGSEYPTSNLYFGNVWKILMLLIELEHDDDDVLRTMAIEMKSKFDKYWFNSEQDDYGMLFAFAMILDPRCKLSVLKFCYENIFGDVEATLRVSDLHLKLEKFYKLYAQTGTSSTLNNNTDMAHASHSRASISSTSTGNRKRKFDYFAVIVIVLLFF